jgi:sensor histidine kinase YesM
MLGVPAREWLGILGFWTFLALLESTKAYVSARARGLPQPLSYVLVGNLPWWYAWALLTPIAFMLARKARLDRRPIGGAIVVHGVASLVLALVHLVPIALLYWFTNVRLTPDPPTAPELVRRLIDGYAMLNVLTYWVVVGGYYALEFHRRYRATELQAARLEARAAHLEALGTEARLAALRMELNPHFLFNTLNAISGLVRRSERDAAVAMLARLGDLLRRTLSPDRRLEIPLSDELESLRLYLDIERARFGDRLRISIDADDDVRDALVPALILQPVVENAVRHGIAQTPGPGEVGVAIHRAGSGLRIEVRDSGPGFPGRDDRREGVGLSNTRARLAQLYGDDASLGIGRTPSGGAAVTITLPFHQAELALAGTAADHRQAP